MILGPIITAIVIAALFTFLFSLFFRGESKMGKGVFFIILFFVIWAGGLWLYPAGPFFWGVAWLPLFVLGLVVALMLSASGTKKRRTPADTGSIPKPRDAKEHNVVFVDEESRRNAYTVSIFFWGLMTVLLVVIVSGYIFL